MVSTTTKARQSAGLAAGRIWVTPGDMFEEVSNGQCFIVTYRIMWLLFIVFHWQTERKIFLYSIYTVWLNTWVISLGGSSPETTPGNYFIPGCLAVAQGHSEKAQNEQVIPRLSELEVVNPDPA